MSTKNLQRLLSPRSIAFVGGGIAEMASRRSLELGFEGEIWPVHRSRDEVAGFKSYPTVGDLPGKPDAAFIAVRREPAIDIVRELSGSGAGGCVCYAAGFAEMGEEGQALQDELIRAAGSMPLVGPNCFGFVNYLDKCALWPYLFGGMPVERGAALISQSGNIAMNLSMNERSVNFTHLIAAGNQAVLEQADYVDALLEDDRVAAIGMYIEGVDDIAHFSRAALRALQQQVPIVVVKVGKTDASARLSGSHTHSLTGSDALFDALCDRLGIIRVDSLNRLLETLKVLVHGQRFAGRKIFSLSCSGGEAAVIADAVANVDLEMPPFSDTQVKNLDAMFPNYVTVSNPFDYNTSIWGDRAGLEQCFTISMQGDHDAALLLYDHPTVAAQEVDEWLAALEAFVAAHETTSKPAFVASTVSELLPEDIRKRLIAAGIAPLQGLDDALFALSRAARYREFLANGAGEATLPDFSAKQITATGEAGFLDESASKAELRKVGVTVPEGEVGTATEAPGIAARIGYPVVVKAVGEDLLHKSELGAVALNLRSADEVSEAVNRISASVANKQGTDRAFLVERMITDAVAELIIGVKRDVQFGPVVVIGAGGILVELVADSVSLLLPTDQVAIRKAIESLSACQLIKGFRGKEAGDMNAIVEAVMSVAAYAEDNRDHLMELDVNPLLVLPDGQGVVAADALIRFSPEE